MISIHHKRENPDTVASIDQLESAGYGYTTLPWNVRLYIQFHNQSEELAPMSIA